MVWIILVAVGILTTGLLAACAAGDLLGLTTKQQSPNALSAKLSPSYRVFKPDPGAGPAPTALLFSGCDGPQDNLETWAAAMTEEGWAAVIVDSHKPRGLDAFQKWRLVCLAQVLPGAERAGDVAVAISDVREMDFVDPERLLLIGASHGGWAILDMLALQKAGELPYNLTRWPDGFEDNHVPGVRAAILLYPYCGALSQVGTHGWSDGFPLLFLLVENDTIVEEAECLRVISEMEESGRRVDVHMFEGVTHGFDQRTKAMFSTLEFDEAATQRSIAITRDFVRETIGE
ncbi:MAG: dienelactone hydrolase family protein [Pseudomonadota bacterium]